MKKVNGLISDLILISGCGLMVYGVWMLSPEAAAIVGGVLLVLIGSAYGLEVKK